MVVLALVPFADDALRPARPDRAPRRRRLHPARAGPGGHRGRVDDRRRPLRPARDLRRARDGLPARRPRGRGAVRRHLGRGRRARRADRSARARRVTRGTASSRATRPPAPERSPPRPGRDLLGFVLKSGIGTSLVSMRNMLAPLALGIVAPDRPGRLLPRRAGADHGARGALRARAPDPADRADARRRARPDRRDVSLAAALRRRRDGRRARARAGRLGADAVARAGRARRRSTSPQRMPRGSCCSRPACGSCSAGRSRSRSRSASRACGSSPTPSRSSCCSRSCSSSETAGARPERPSACWSRRSRSPAPGRAPLRLRREHQRPADAERAAARREGARRLGHLAARRRRPGEPCTRCRPLPAGAGPRGRGGRDGLGRAGPRELSRALDAPVAARRDQARARARPRLAPRASGATSSTRPACSDAPASRPRSRAGPSSSSSPATLPSSGFVPAVPSAGDVDSFQEQAAAGSGPSAQAAQRSGAATSGARLHAERLPARSRDRLGRGSGAGQRDAEPDAVRAAVGAPAGAAQPLRSRGPALAFAGRLTAQKSLDVLVAAVAACPEVALVVAGDGDQREAVIDDVSGRGLGRPRAAARRAAARGRAPSPPGRRRERALVELGELPAQRRRVALRGHARHRDERGRRRRGGRGRAERAARSAR